LDLGTTNSALFRMGPKGPEVVPVRQQNYLPSAVALTRRGDVKVGADALKPDFDPVARWFKRLMGTTNGLLVGDGSEWSPQALSAEVLKELKAAARRRFDEDVEDVVVTVPAMFMQPQCVATNQAAEMAGMRAVTLLQEPIAAATAFLSDEPRAGHYLVYDLGGGTFDVSLVRLRDGEMNVLEHGGDNYLGGSDFDRAVFDWTLHQLERKGCDTGLFAAGRNRFLLMRACEDARLALSDGEEASIYLDELDLPVAKVDLSKSALEDLIEPFVTKTIEITRDRLRNRGMSPRDVTSVLLVGGPTQTPYVRRRLREELGIDLNFDQDPMTVVAKGAAIHAGTILKAASLPSAATLPTGTAILDLFFEPVSPEPFTSIAGKVTTPAEFRGEVKLTSASGDLDTGWRTLINGAFSVDVTLGRGAATEFRIELRDMQGTPVPCEPNAVVIRSGVRAAQPVTAYHYGVVLEGGKTVRHLIQAGKPLPASGSQQFRLARTLVAGSPEEVRIYFTEGSSATSDDNVKVGLLTIRGTDIRRSLKENEELQIRMRMNDSRMLSAAVYVPLLDEEWKVDMHPFTERPDHEELGASIVEVRYAVREIEALVEEPEQDLIMRSGRQIEQLEATLDRVARGETGEAERVHKQLSDTRAALRPLLDKYGIRALHGRVVELIESADALCDYFGDSMGVAKLRDLRGDADKCLRLGDEKTLTGVHERVREIFWEHYGKTRECWEYQIHWMRESAPAASDPLALHELIRRAEDALARNDYEGVRLLVLRALDLLPDRERMKNRFFDAAVR
jgi:molecular chaperone DnaK